MEYFQTLFAQQLTSYLSNQLHSRIHVDKVKIRFFRSLSLEGFYIEDLHKDTLFYSREFNVAINDFSSARKMIDLEQVTLSHSKFFLQQYAKEKHDNLRFLVDYFSSNDTTSATTSTPWKISFKNIRIEDLEFRNRVEDDSMCRVGVDFSNLKVQRIYGDLNNISFVNDSIFVTLDKLRFRDQSGFEVNEFSAKAKVASDQMRFEKLKIITPFTQLQTDLTFDYTDWPDFDEFTSKIKWRSDFKDSKVAFDDIAYFAHDLWGIHQAVTINGLFDGSVNKFKGKEVLLTWGKKSLFQGNINISGLPLLGETYMNIRAKQIQTDRQDVETIPLPPFFNGNHVKLPDNLNVLGLIRFNGQFTGFFTDFVAFGNVTTAIGSISSDINVKYDQQSQSSEYQGHISAHQFNVGKISGIRGMGLVTFNTNVKGHGMRLDNINANFSGIIEALEFRNYTYRNIKANGEIAKKLFKGVVAIHEPNVDLDFSGDVDFRKKLPEFNFNADLHHAHLDTLNLVNMAGENSLQTTVSSRLRGNNLDNLEGNVLVENTLFLVDKKLYHINKIELHAVKSENGEKSLELNSDFLDAQINGQYELATLLESFKQFIPRYLPSVVIPSEQSSGQQDFIFAVQFKNTSFLTENFYPVLTIDPLTTLKGRVNSILNTLQLKFSSPYIIYRAFRFRDLELNLATHEHSMVLESNSEQVYYSDSSYVNKFLFNAEAENNHIAFQVHIADSNLYSNRARLKGSVDFISDQHFTVRLDSSEIVVDNASWAIDSGNQITLDSGIISVRNFYLFKGIESVRIEGVVGSTVSDKLTVQFDGFHLKNLNPLLKSANVILSGITAGTVVLNQVNKKWQVESNLTIQDLGINNDTLGRASIQSHYNSGQEVVMANIIIERGTAKVVDVSGQYDLAGETDNLHFDVKLNNFYLHPVERYLHGILSELGGKASASLTLTGTFSKPVFNGTVDLVRVSCLVDYLNTRYSFTTQVKVRENEFNLNGMKLVDVYNNEAEVRGKIFHDYFRNFIFDVEVFPSKFQILNTRSYNNSLYYGTAFASGYAHFYGPLEYMNMDINIAPDRGSIINIPLTTTADVSKSDFISFVDHSQKSQSTTPKNLVDLSGVKLNMNLEMNSQALINLIFDEKIGDVISGYGTGSLRLDINTSGEFNMFGTYSIEKGDYLFTLQNVINKKFTIDPGGRITWAGDPYDATIDLSATYVVYTSSLQNLLQQDTVKVRLPVDLRLFLKNKLMNPTISYEINVRGLDPTKQILVNNILSSEQEVNRQMFGLLVLNQFVPQSGTSTVSGRIDAGAGATASATQLLSNQVSNWLSQVSKDVNIGFNYQARDSYSPGEIQLMLSKSLFNDRLIVEGNVGYLNYIPTRQNQSNSSVVGDFNAEYKVSQDGRLRLKGFNRSNLNNVFYSTTAPYTQGFGIFFRQEFDSLKDLMIRLRLKKQPAEVKKQ